MPTILVTGGAGFIGSNFVLEWIQRGKGRVVNLDLLTYAGNPRSLRDVQGTDQHLLVCGDIRDGNLVRSLLHDEKPVAIVHFAAESHVDRSILGPEAFLKTNVEGTFTLLQEALRYYGKLHAGDQERFRFLHVSTDEVYGSLAPDDPPFHERTPFAPNSPYAASKAGSDHLVRAWFHTYRLPVLITNCSNNYGPFQFPEKLLPLIIHNALAGKALPIYGDGLQVRDWLYVRDHCRAIETVLQSGKPGETYNVGGNNQQTNLSVVTMVCHLLDELKPREDGASYKALRTFVQDRPGHDRRYAVDAGKLRRELGWQPEETFATGLRKTVQWYLSNQAWIQEVTSGSYRNWIDENYAKRADSDAASAVAI